MTEPESVASEVSEPSPKPSKPANPTVQLLGIVVAGILAFALLVWAQGVRMAAERREAFGRGIDGLAAALAIPVIETGSRVSDNRQARLQSTIESIQRAGKYDTLVVSDASGNVIASTNTALSGQTIKAMAEAKSPTTEKEANGMIEATSAILNDGGVKIGALQVRVKL